MKNSFTAPEGGYLQDIDLGEAEELVRMGRHIK